MKPNGLDSATRPLVLAGLGALAVGGPNGWRIGAGPSVVLIDKGLARTLNTTTLTQDVYAMIFGQQGLMGGLGIKGSKITRIQPGP